MKIERDLYWEPVEGEVEYCGMESLIGAWHSIKTW
jgi:hypothetical protein